MHHFPLAFEGCVSVEIPVHMHFRGDRVASGTAFNITRVGLLIRTRDACPRSGPVDVLIPVPEPDVEHIVRLPASVGYSGRRVVGLMMRGLDDDREAAVQRLLCGGESSWPCSQRSVMGNDRNIDYGNDRPYPPNP